MRADEEGRFRIDAPPGPVVLRVSAQGYDDARVAVAADARDEAVVVRLSVSDAAYSATGVGEANPDETASSLRLSARDLSAAPRRNAEEVLRQVPGLTLVQHGSEGKGHQFYLRGFDAMHGVDFEITVDGLPANEWSNVHAQGYLDLAFVIPELIDGVDVTKGPFALRQGPFAMAGSAEYRLGAPVDQLGWRAAYTVGTTNRHRLFLGYSPRDGDGQAFVGVAATHDDGFGQQRRLRRGALNARVPLLDRGDEGRLHLTVLGAYSRFALPGILRNDDIAAGRVGFYGAYDDATDGESARALASLRFVRTQRRHSTRAIVYGGYRRLALLENFTGFLIDPVNGDRRDQAQDTWSYGADGEHTIDLPGRPVTARMGVGLRGDRFDQREENVGQALETVAVRRDLTATQLVAHARAGVSWAPLDGRLRLRVGARADVVHVRLVDHVDMDARSRGTRAVVSPRASLQARPVDGLRLFAAYGRGYRPPEARAFSSFDPTTTGLPEELFSGGSPRPTMSDALEVGVRWDPTRAFGARLSMFGTFIERESVFDHVSGVNLELNGTRRLGAELLLETWPTSYLRVAADVTAVDARFRDSGARVPFAPWLTAGLRATLTHPSGIGAGLRVVAVAPRPLPFGARGSTLLMSDVTVSYAYRFFRVHLEIENLLNRRLREGEYHYASHFRPGEPASQLPALHTSAGPPLNARLTLGIVY